MPFKSEKQRRFLWAAHPDIAKRWAHEYPKSNKGLPMYAHKKKDEKEAALSAIHRYVNKLNNSLILPVTLQNKPSVKAANSKQTYIEIPHSETPTYAGEEREQNPEKAPDFDVTLPDKDKPGKRRENAINSLLRKIAIVVGPNIKKMKEEHDAALEGREPVYVPQNENVKRYPVATPGIMPPMGMQPQAPQQAQAKQPQSRPSAPPVGNGSSPISRPIQTAGGLSVKNDLTGNSGSSGGRNPGAGLKTSSFRHVYAKAVAALQKRADSSSFYARFGNQPGIALDRDAIAQNQQPQPQQQQPAQGYAGGGVTNYGGGDVRPVSMSAQRPAPQAAGSGNYSSTPWTREYAEAAFKQHGIPYSPKATDQQLYNLYVRRGQIPAGKQPNPFQAMLKEHHGGLQPPPLQPSAAPAPSPGMRPASPSTLAARPRPGI